MEHRYFPRLRESFDVVLQSRTAGRVDAHVLNVSKEGMCLAINAAPFPKGSSVDVSLPEEKSSLFGVQQLRAVVVYAHHGMMGLLLIDEDRGAD